ncbi:MAG: sialoglycan-binding domain-containing protein, partial [Desulfatiglandales bacterium]
DGTAPTLSPVAVPAILWPPNHNMVDVTIYTNASDNSGGPVTLNADIYSSEPPETDGDGNTVPDYTDPLIDQATGEITLQLRSERSGKGDGRTYTVLITATDESGNSSSAEVKILAPHDKSRLSY